MLNSRNYDSATVDKLAMKSGEIHTLIYSSCSTSGFKRMDKLRWCNECYEIRIFGGGMMFCNGMTFITIVVQLRLFTQNSLLGNFAHNLVDVGKYVVSSSSKVS